MDKIDIMVYCVGLRLNDPDITETLMIYECERHFILDHFEYGSLEYEDNLTLMSNWIYTGSGKLRDLANNLINEIKSKTVETFRD